MTLVVYMKCRPQGADAWPIARDYHCIFVGYPPWLPNADRSRATGFTSSIVDLRRDDWRDLMAKPGNRQVASHAKLVRNLKKGAFAMVPRPQEGMCYIGKIASDFELVDDPPWGPDYLRIRSNSGLDDDPPGRYLSDVVQCWQIEEWRPMAFALVPRWISYRLLSRNTSGIIHDLPDGLGNVHETVQRLYGDAPLGKITLIENDARVERRPLD